MISEESIDLLIELLQFFQGVTDLQFVAKGLDLHLRRLTS